MKNLTVKEVCFDSKKVLALEKNGKIYVSVKSVCRNLGMDKSQADHQIQKIQKDEFLKGACKFKHLQINGIIQNVMMIELDYLPIWLAKINPARFSKELKEQLLEYQLKAKDVLAEAFLGKRVRQVPTVPMLGHKTEKFTYNGEIVLTLRDFASMLGVARITISDKLKHKHVISGNEMAAFKSENSQKDLKCYSCMTIIDKDEAIQAMSKISKIPESARRFVESYFQPYMDKITLTKEWEFVKKVSGSVQEQGKEFYEELAKVDESIRKLQTIRQSIAGSMRAIHSAFIELER